MGRIKIHLRKCLICVVLFFGMILIVSKFHKRNDLHADNPSKITTQSSNAWPPEKITELFDHITKTFNLQIRPQVVEDAESLLMGEHRFNRIRSIYRGPPIGGSRLKQLVNMEKHAHISGQYPSHEVYPQIIDLPEAVHAVRVGRPVKQKPINDPPLHVFRYPAEVCHPHSVNQPQDLIVVIKSCTSCSAHRDKSRNSFMRPSLWSNFAIQFVFVTGLPTRNREITITIDGYIYDAHMKAGGKTVSAEQEEDELLRESDTHKDMLIGQFDDHYFNLTLKQMFTLRWVATFCRHRAPLFLFVDDDYAIRPEKLIQLVRYIQPVSSRPHVNIGGQETVNVERAKKGPSVINSCWAIPEDDIPWERYMGISVGGAYMLGSEVVTEVAIGGIFTRSMHLDDIFLGFVLAKLRRPMYKLDGLFSNEGNDAAIVLHSKLT